MDNPAVERLAFRWGLYGGPYTEVEIEEFLASVGDDRSKYDPNSHEYGYSSHGNGHKTRQATLWAACLGWTLADKSTRMHEEYSSKFEAAFEAVEEVRSTREQRELVYDWANSFLKSVTWRFGNGHWEVKSRSEERWHAIVPCDKGKDLYRRSGDVKPLSTLSTSSISYTNHVEGATMPKLNNNTPSDTTENAIVRIVRVETYKDEDGVTKTHLMPVWASKEKWTKADVNQVLIRFRSERDATYRVQRRSEWADEK